MTFLDRWFVRIEFKLTKIKFRFLIPNSSSPVDTIKLRNSTFKSNHSLPMIKSDFEFGQNLENWKFDFKIIKQKITQNVRYWIKLVRTGSRSGLTSWEKNPNKMSSWLSSLCISVVWMRVTYPRWGQTWLGKNFSVSESLMFKGSMGPVGFGRSSSNFAQLYQCRSLYRC